MGIVIKDVSSLIIAKDGKWIINPTKKLVYEKLTKKFGLKSIIVINDARKLVLKKQGIMGSNEYYSNGYGVFANTKLGNKTYVAATSFLVQIYLLNPLASLSSKLTDINRPKETPIMSGVSGFSMRYQPKDFENWSEKEMEPFKAKIKYYLLTLRSKELKLHKSILCKKITQNSIQIT